MGSLLGFSVALSHSKAVAPVRTRTFVVDGAATRSLRPIGTRQTVLRVRDEPPPDVRVGKSPSPPSVVPSSGSPTSCTRGNLVLALPLASTHLDPLIGPAQTSSCPPVQHFLCLSGTSGAHSAPSPALFRSRGSSRPIAMPIHQVFILPISPLAPPSPRPFPSVSIDGGSVPSATCQPHF